MLAFEYKLTAANVLDAFKAIEKLKKKWIRTLIYAVLIVLLIAYWVAEYVRDNMSTGSYFLAAIAFTLFMVALYYPHKRKKDIAKMVELADEELYMEFSGENVYFSRDHEDGRRLSEIDNLIETEKSFIIDGGEDKVYCLPKTAVGESESELREILKSGNYIDRRKN